MKKIFNTGLILFSGAIGSICMMLVGLSTGTISALTIYEPEMPDALKPKDEETE